MIDAKLLAYCAQEVEMGDDPIDWGMIPVKEEDIYRLMAECVVEIENDELVLKASIVKLLVENFVLNLQRM